MGFAWFIWLFLNPSLVTGGWSGIWDQVTSGLGGRDVAQNLGSLLSPNATVYLPGSEGFTNATARWSESGSQEPQFAAVVKAATEHDVQQAILYANANKQPFLAIGGAHGSTQTLAKCKNGIGIWLRGMAGFHASEDGTKAIIKAGSQSGEVRGYFFSQGKSITTSNCDCVGLFGALLGGGHGWLQGQHGLLIDNLISARVVLASGELITVSKTQHPDLFWAMRGAGQNFGIVTSIEYKLFDRDPETDNWAFQIFTFSQDKLEDVFKIANQQCCDAPEKKPVQLAHYITWERQPDLDPTNPVIVYRLMWQGPKIPAQYSNPLKAIKSLSVTSGLLAYDKLNSITGADYDGQNCIKGTTKMLYPVASRSYNLTALRTTFDIFSSLPPWLNTSAMLLEGYSTAAVRQVPSESTAYPDRYNELLISPIVHYFPGTGTFEEAAKYGAMMRDALAEGTGHPLNAYVNYAIGDESLEAVYGYEPWRLQKLRQLKKEYDPAGKFGFFEPIY